MKPKRKRRPGAGRKALDGVTGTIKLVVTVTEQHVLKAAQIGNGNVSLGTRKAIEKY